MTLSADIAYGMTPFACLTPNKSYGTIDLCAFSSSLSLLVLAHFDIYLRFLQCYWAS
jgi:hypothetical protein